jgi:hypothetical protein
LFFSFLFSVIPLVTFARRAHPVRSQQSVVRNTKQHPALYANTFRVRLAGVLIIAPEARDDLLIILEIIGANPAKVTGAPPLSEEAPEDGGNLACQATKTCAALAEFTIQFAGRLDGAKDFFQELVLRAETVSIRMARVRPMRQQPGAHVRELPHPPAIVERAMSS